MKMEQIGVRRVKLMGILSVLAVVGLMVVVGACANSVKFPISTVTPAADIVAVRSHDGNGNTMMRITARNLAAVDRIASPKKAYVVWIVTDRDGAKNVGKLTNRNSRTARLETLIPAYSTEVFITAEEDGEVTAPSGIEITRIRFEK
jgi:hypothetical protein